MEDEPSPRHWPVELWRKVWKRKREQVDDEGNQTVIPDDVTEAPTLTPTSPAGRAKTVEPFSPLPELDEAADEVKEQEEEPKEVAEKTFTKEEVSEEKKTNTEEDNMSDSEIARTLADLMQSTKDSGKAKSC